MTRPAEAAEIVLRNDGFCPVCDAPSRFTARDPWLRDHYRCDRCGSIPRERALITVLERQFPKWRDFSIHESSPGLPSSERLRRHCRSYLSTHYFPDARLGEIEHGFRNEDLARQTFEDESFDLVITQDVMEHVLDPEAAFREIARTLRPGGAHLFTTPIYPGLQTSERRARERDGAIEYLAEPEYHSNPIDEAGSLVTMHWGQDIGAIITRSSGLQTTVYVLRDRELGIDGDFLEVLVSRKVPADAGSGQTGWQTT
jgi:methyltransferase family protein